MKRQTIRVRTTDPVEKIVDRRGKERTIKHYTGVNKGKTYPYASKKRGG